ncbi:MAG: molybdopterin-dependent oxidoreductase [Chromatiales bacterium]|nr:MAG: molybdopterin-dependent oxidoreductase [Chromatiales bacterium]
MDTEVTTRVRTNCRACGHAGCGAYVEVVGGKATRILPDKAHPISKGYLCRKARGFIDDMQYHPDRLKYPMRRAGERGEGKWERISWDEALTAIAAKFNQIKDESGPEAVVFGHGTGRSHHRFIYRLANAFGSPNVLANGHICYLPRLAVSKQLGMSVPIVDYDNHPQCIMSWGSNTIVSNADEYIGVNLALNLKHHPKYIVVDPQRTKLAEKADIWLQLRPGTDVALAMAMMHVMVAEDLYDKEFVEKYSHGFDQFAERLKEYTPEVAEQITWVPKDKIIAAARLFAEIKPAAIQWGVGIEHNVNCANSDRCLIYMSALTGNLDAPGGNVMFGPPPGLPRMEFCGQNFHDAVDRMLGGEKYRLAASINRTSPHAVWDAIEYGDPYQARALLIMGSNPLVARENTERVERCLKKVEFLVMADVFPTPSTELADIVLPAATWLEFDNIADYWKSHGYIFPRPKIVEPEGEAMSDIEILNELGKKLGFEDQFWDSYEDSLDYILEPEGITWEQFKDMGYLRNEPTFRKYETEGFKSPSGKFELYIQQNADWGYDPLPAHMEPPESPAREPEFVQKYPLVLTTGTRVKEYFGSEHRHSKFLRKKHPAPLLTLHPDAAAARGIADGDWVYIENPRGKVKHKARVFDGIDPRVVAAEFGWWYPELDAPGYGYRDCNINLLTDDLHVGPESGATNLKGLMCEVTRVPDQETADPGQLEAV